MERMHFFNRKQLGTKSALHLLLHHGDTNTTQTPPLFGGFCVPVVRKDRGFTLLEVLIVLFILGLLAAMSVPAMGILDNREREKITLKRMDAIRGAILGPEDRYDHEGRPVIGGYVGDMKRWPDLWEARAEIRPDFAGVGWENPGSMAAGLGQGPDYTVDPAHVFFRPSGVFEKKRFRWHRPYRKLYDMSTNDDHTGGLETENEGQPRGLWTRYPEELNVDLPGHPRPGEDLGDDWKGPYLAVPHDMYPKDSASWAINLGAYESLEPVWHTSGAHANHETWEDGNNAPLTELGEHFDEKEAFRILETEGRLSDGWGRAFRFFITVDPDAEPHTIFWILSEGPDGEGTYPSKGTSSGHTWMVDGNHTMGRAYDETDVYNQDNLVLKLYSRDFQAFFDEENQDKIRRTEHIMDTLVRALSGTSPSGDNSGFTGNFCAWPRLFRWEDNNTPLDTSDDHWDDRDSGDTSYTKGHPLGLWTRTPNSADPLDDLSLSAWGIGWRYGHLAPPPGVGNAQVAEDDWGREILFFSHTGDGALLFLSSGPDGLYAFGTDGDHTEDMTTLGYDPSLPVNVDNIVRVLDDDVMTPGFFRLDQLVVIDATAGVTKCCFFGNGGFPVSGVDLLTAGGLVDHDGDTFADDWVVGDGTPSDPAFDYNDISAQTAIAGARYLVVWNDTDGNDGIDSGEMYTKVIYLVGVQATSGEYGVLVEDTTDFELF